MHLSLYFLTFFLYLKTLHISSASIIGGRHSILRNISGVHGDVLNISNNYIGSVDINALGAFSLLNTTSVHTLYFTHNKALISGVINFTATFSQLSFKTIQFAHNDELSFGHDVFEDSFIQHISLVQCNLQSLPTALQRGLNTLETLRCTGNNITLIDVATFHNLQQLTVLNISGNHLSSLRGNFSKHGHLVHLDVSHNRISSLTTHVFDGLATLESLNISHNLLLSLPDLMFSKLSDLLDLNLECNDLDDLSGDLLKIPVKIRRINLSNNSLNADVIAKGVLYGLESVTHVYLGHNLIDSLPKHMLCEHNVAEVLDLNNNLIKTLGNTNFDNYEHLRKIDLSYNKLSFICPRPFSALKSPRSVHVNITGNPARDISICLSTEFNIEGFHVVGNKSTNCKDIYDYDCSTGSAWIQECLSRNSWGETCKKSCNCGVSGTDPCDPVSGACLRECKPGEFGETGTICTAPTYIDFKSVEWLWILAYTGIFIVVACSIHLLYRVAAKCWNYRTRKGTVLIAPAAPRLETDENGYIYGQRPRPREKTTLRSKFTKLFNDKNASRPNIDSISSISESLASAPVRQGPEPKRSKSEPGKLGKASRPSFSQPSRKKSKI